MSSSKESTRPTYINWLLFAGVAAILAFLGIRSCEEPEDFDLSSIKDKMCYELTDTEMFSLDELDAVDAWNRPFMYVCKSHGDGSKVGVWVLIPLNGKAVVGEPVIRDQSITYNVEGSTGGKSLKVCYYEFPEGQDPSFTAKMYEGGGVTVVVTADKDHEQPISTGGSVPFSGFTDAAQPCLIVFAEGSDPGTGQMNGSLFGWPSSTFAFVAPRIEPTTGRSVTTIESDPIRRKVIAEPR